MIKKELKHFKNVDKVFSKVYNYSIEFKIWNYIFMYAEKKLITIKQRLNNDGGKEQNLRDLQVDDHMIDIMMEEKSNG